MFYLPTQTNAFESLPEEKKNHTFALIKGYEDYETLNTGFKNVRYAISKLVEQGYMEIDGNKVHLHFHLGGDYKVSEIHVLYGF